MNWTTILTEEARNNCIVRTDNLARKHKLSERVVRDALRRYEAQGLVERVSTKIYINHFNQQFSLRDLVTSFGLVLTFHLSPLWWSEASLLKVRQY
jgi:hypothetical protein